MKSTEFEDGVLEFKHYTLVNECMKCEHDGRMKVNWIPICENSEEQIKTKLHRK